MSPNVYEEMRFSVHEVTRSHNNYADYRFQISLRATLLYYRGMVRMEAVEEKPLITEIDAVVAAAQLFHCFSDPSRLVILQHLQLGEHRVIDLTQHLGLSQSTVSKHLACLKESDLVTSRPEGRSSMYTLNHSDELVALLSAAETLLALTADAVTLCPLHGEGVAHA